MTTSCAELSINQLRFDTDVQCRASIDSGTVTEYKEALGASVVFPPLVVFHDGKTYWVADGFHRGSAYRESGATKCPCDVRQGTKRDAILYAVGANTGHGLRRSNADKRRAVETLLKDSEWSKWSDREVGKRVGVDHTFVGRLRSSGVEHQIATVEPRKAIRNGKEYTIDTSNIGKTKPVEKVEAAPVEKWEPQDDDFCHAGPNREDFDQDEEEGDQEDGEEATRIEQEARDAGEEPVAAEVVRKDLDADEARAIIKGAKSAVSAVWFNCPVAFRWKLKGIIENHLADLSEA